jgi:hypothetical protein
MVNGQGQYWTLQDSLLGYNAFYTSSVDKDGNLKWGDIISVRKSCGSDLQFKLPPNAIEGSTSVSSLKSSGPASVNDFSIKIAKGKYLFILKNNAPTNAYIGILDLKGRVLSKFAVPTNERIFSLPFTNSFSKGIYQVVYQANGSQKMSKLIAF